MVTAHCGAFRNKLMVDNSNSIKKTISIVFCHGECVPRHSMLCSFISGLNCKHQLSSSVKILCNASQSWSTNSKLQHQPDALSVQTLRSAAQTLKKPSFSANSFQNLPGCFLTHSKTFGEWPNGYSPVLHHNGASFLQSFIGPSRNWLAWTRIILQQLPAFLKTHKPSEDVRTSQDGHHCTQLSGLGTFPWQFSSQVKFNHGTLLHVKNVDHKTNACLLH